MATDPRAYHLQGRYSLYWHTKFVHPQRRLCLLDLCYIPLTSSHSSRSVDSQWLQTERTRTELGRRAFSVAAPTAWNSPPAQLRLSYRPLLICCHPFSTTYISSSLRITNRSLCYASPHLWNQLPVSLRQPCIKHHPDDVTLSNSPAHLLTTLTLHHTFTVSFQAQNSPFPQIFSTIVW